jgi:hypothetical protein
VFACAEKSNELYAKSNTNIISLSSAVRREAKIAHPEGKRMRSRKGWVAEKRTLPHAVGQRAAKRSGTFYLIRFFLIRPGPQPLRCLHLRHLKIIRSSKDESFSTHRAETSPKSGSEDFF